MGKMYINYWKKSFVYTGKANLSEFFNALGGNIIIILLILLAGIVVPVTWENAVVNIMYGIEILMIIPTISLIIRLLKKSKKRKLSNKYF
ncbi:MAG: hypothetical protein KH815_11705 [Enterococcus hirae]|nr:hypothetical protein [Enterococcus hirae]